MQRPRTAEVTATAAAIFVIVVAWVTLWPVSSAGLWSSLPVWMWSALAGGVVAIGAVLALRWLLGTGARRLAGELRELTADEREKLTVSERVEAVNQARQSLLQAGTGLVVITGVVFTAAGLIYTARTLETTQQGQVTDRYTKAIEQLGSDKTEVRLGAIYALERLMGDSPRDRQTITEVLASYVRVHAQDKPSNGTPSGRLAIDTQAGLTVLGRRDHTRDDVRPDLSNVDFHGKQFNISDLHGADLRGANLRDVGLRGANLTGADLRGADLRRAGLDDADLRGAHLDDADLRGAYLTSTNLRGARMSDADLSGAHLEGGDLRGVDLVNALLSSADLHSALLSGANLAGADLRGAELINADLRGADLRGVADLRLVRGQSPEEIRRVTKTDATTRF